MNPVDHHIIIAMYGDKPSEIKKIPIKSTRIPSNRNP
jgi:hypothetical protein